MKALIDGDILRYEIGFASETGWRAITEQEHFVPPWDYVEDLLCQRIEQIVGMTGSTDYTLYLTEGRTFRYDIAKRKPYKGTRVDKKPWHFNNLTIYMRDILNAKIITEIEADDAIAIDHMASGGTTIICSRDKDLRQIPGLFYSWELGNQPAFGPVVIEKAGSLSLSKDKKKVTGTGFSFFCSQLLTGDRVDNIPGLDGIGPVAAFHRLVDNTARIPDIFEDVVSAYKEHYGNEWEKELLEQGQLCWIVRKRNEDGSPVLWQIGMTE